MKRSSVIGLVIIAIAIAVIVSIYSDSSTYSTFGEAKKEKEEIVVAGQLNKQRQMEYDPHKNANYFSFYAIDKTGEECKVIFSGTKPQDFERSETITMTGKMVGNDFYASRILMKCPSKYNKDQVEVRGAAAPAVKI
jgi:cytochrome c-type biogenesis protein CcmE